MLVEFSIVPIGSDSSLSPALAEVMKIVHESGMPYKINPMGTVMEGEWEQIFRLLKKCHKTVLKKQHRVLTSITIDDRKGKPGRLNIKVKSVEKKLGMKLKK